MLLDSDSPTELPPKLVPVLSNPAAALLTRAMEYSRSSVLISRLHSILARSSFHLRKARSSLLPTGTSVSVSSSLRSRQCGPGSGSTWDSGSPAVGTTSAGMSSADVLDLQSVEDAPTRKLDKGRCASTWKPTQVSPQSHIWLNSGPLLLPLHGSQVTVPGRRGRWRAWDPPY